ncbi:hypothetical protein ACFXOH_24160, partial [Bacillus subtilis]
EADIRDAVDARKALAAQRRAAAPASRVAELHRYNRWTRFGCAAIICAGLVWSAINVQNNMAPGGSADPMFWASFLVDGMISGLLIILALGAAKVQESGHEPSTVTRLAEIALFGFALAMNTYPYLKDGHYYAATLHGIAPTMIGASMLVLHSLGKDYTHAREIWAAQITPGETVHLPQVPTVHRAGPRSNLHALPETVQHAPEVGTVQADETVQHAAPAATATVQRAESATTRTEQFPRTTAYGTVQHAPSEEAATAPELSVQEPVHTAQHTAQSANTTGPAQFGDSLADLDDGTSPEPAHLPGIEHTPAQHTAQTAVAAPTVQTVQAEETVHPAPVAETVTEAEPWSPAEETEQFPSTAHPDQVTETVHRAPVQEAVHRAPRGNRAPVHPEKSEHRAEEAATEQGTGEDDAELWALAAEVHPRIPRKDRYAVADVARVLIAHRRQGLGVDRIYRDKIGPHRDTTGRWLALATQVEQERTGPMAPVISLRG